MFSRRLTFGARLTLLVGLMALPIVLLASILTSDALGDIRQIQTERQGVTCLQRLWTGGAGDDACAGLTDGRPVSQPSVAALFADVADRSQITLDRDIDTYYLGNVATVQLPRLLEATQPGDAGSASQPGERVGGFVTAAEGAYAKAYAATPPGLRPQVDVQRAAMAAAITRFRASSRDMAASDRLASELGPVWRATAASLDAALQRHQRMRAMQWGGNALLVALITAAAVAVAVYIHRSITRQTGALVEATRRLMQGETSVEIPYLDDANEPGRLANALAALRDVQAERAGLLKESQAASRAKSEFLANMSHEIRTPLAAVIGFGELIESDAAAGEPVRRHASRITAAGRTLLAIVNDVLDFSMLEARRLRFERQPFGLAELVAESLDLVRATAEGRGLALSATVDPAAPSRLVGDVDRLRQVLLNLLGNAIKFTERGGVSVTAVWRDGRLRLEVVDTGVGIAPEAMAQLFERFSQADQSTTRRFGGSGLGLAICKGLVEGMGGRVGATSVLGQGSVFWFETPAEAAAAPQAPAPSPAPPEAAGARVLVVDDADRNRELIGVILQSAGHEVVYAHDGAEAVDLTTEARFDLILMDMQMPVMDGPSATRLIRERPGPNRRAPIVAVSANILPEHVAACLAAGMDAHLAKPIAAASLLETVAGWLSHGHAG